MTETKKKTGKALKAYAVRAKSGSVNHNGKLFLRGVIYQVTAAQAAEYQTNPRLEVWEKDKGAPMPSKKETSEKASEPAPKEDAIPKTWTKNLKKMETTRVSDMREFADEIDDIKLVEFLLENAERKGARTALERRLEDLQE